MMTVMEELAYYETYWNHQNNCKLKLLKLATCNLDNIATPAQSYVLPKHDSPVHVNMYTLHVTIQVKTSLVSTNPPILLFM